MRFLIQNLQKEKSLHSNKEDDIIALSFFKKQQKAIAKANRNISTKRLRSNNRHKAQLTLARLHRKVTNQRNAYHWRLARELCKKYAIICFEDLNMKQMQKKHGKKVGDYGFGEFLRILEYVAPQFNTKIVKIDRFFSIKSVVSRMWLSKSRS